MKIFVSWAGARSRVLGSCMQAWLQELMPEDELFHSDEIPKGAGWHTALTNALRECNVGVFCVTPESLRSQWMLFEAGALSQAREEATLLAYLYGTSEIEGPLAHFQTTRFDRDDSRKFVASLAALRGGGEDASIDERFESAWPGFEAKVLRLMAHPVQEVLPEFPSLFETRKTFSEPFPRCSDKRWGARIARIAGVRERLSTQEYSEIMSSDPYLSGAYKRLLELLERYRMHIEADLIESREFGDLESKKRKRLEGARREIADLVRSLQQRFQPPVFRESFSFESESDTANRKMAIHEMENRLGRGELADEKVDRGRHSLNWGLDRIVFYLAAGAQDSEVSVGDLIRLARLEEEQARTRGLVTGLQPLYYALECVDERLRGPLDQRASARLTELVGDVTRFIEAHEGRDTGGHIERRLDSLSRKLQAEAAPE